MKVWVVGRRIPSKLNGMLGSFEFGQAKMLASRGMDICYIAFDPRSIRHLRKFGMVTGMKDGILTAVLSIPIGKLMSSIAHYDVMCRMLPGMLRRLARKYGVPDVVHIHYTSLWSFEAFREIQSAGAAIVTTEHWSKVQNKTLPSTNLEKLKSHVAGDDVMICVGEPLVKSVRELTHTNRPIHVVPNIVPDYFYYSPDVRSTETGVFRFVCAGRMVYSKRFDMLIKAFSNVFAGHKHVFLDIIGDGVERRALEKLVRDSKCADRIIMHGMMDREETAQMMSKGNVLVVSSNFETFGVPAIEGLACGMPVVTSDALGFLSYINEENGIVFPMDDESALSEALLEVYLHYDRYDRAKIAQDAKDHFGETAIYNMLSYIYDSARNRDASNNEKEKR